MKSKIQFLFLSFIALMSASHYAQDKTISTLFSGNKTDNLEELFHRGFSSGNTRTNSIFSEAAENGSWSGDYGLPGVDQFLLFYNVVFSVASTGNEIYVGGSFKYAQDSIVNNIAKLDGVKFCSLAGGTNGIVYAIKTSGNNVYVGGDFDTAGVIRVNNIAMWDGSAWHALGEGVNGPVRAIEVAGDTVFAGGNFDSAGTSSAKNIAVWNGAEWAALGEGTTGVVYAIKNTGGGLYLGGGFDSAGTVPVNNITKWNGTAYEPLSSGTNGNVNAIETDAEVLYVGGNFSQAGGSDIYGIAKWESGSWSNVGSGVDGGVYDIALYDGDLYIGGNFGNVGILAANGIAKWDGVQWSTFDGGMYLTMMDNHGAVASIEIFDGYLFAAGGFNIAGHAAVNNLAYWDISEWRGVGPAPVIGGANWLVHKVAARNNELYAGGEFTMIGNTQVSRFAKWDGSAWNDLGGATSSAEPPVVRTIYCSLNDVYIGGYFDMVGSVNARNIAKWNGTMWSPLGDGLNGSVRDIKQVGTDIYAGGAFDSAGSVPAFHIARWNGSVWSALGNGLNGTVLSILPVGSELYAAGFFVLSGMDTMNYIAKWDGFSWSNLGKGFNQRASILCYDNGLLYAGGTFTEADGNAASYVAVWDGVSWAPVGTGLSLSAGGGGVTGLVMADDKLYASGTFDHAGITSVNNVAVFDEGSWQPLDEGLTGLYADVYSSEIVYRGVSDYDIYFGGIFSLAGGKTSYNLAKYSITAVDVHEDENHYPHEFALLQNFPNPFNPATSIQYRVGSLPARLVSDESELAGKAGIETVTLKIYDVLGNEVALLVNEEKQAGEYRIRFDAGDLSSGVYFYQLKAGPYLETKKMMLLK